MGAGLTIVAAAAAGLVIWPPPLPEQTLLQARRAYASARLAPGLLPADLALADSLHRRLDDLYAAERGRLLRIKKPVAIEATAAALIEAATAVTATAQQRQEAGMQRRRLERLALEERLARLAGPVATMKGARQLRQAYQQAQLDLGGARTLESQGDLAALTVQLEAASQAVDRAEVLLDRRTVRLHDPSLQRLWQSWVDETIAATSAGRDAIIVDKLHRRCVVVRNAKVSHRYTIELGRNGLVDKLHAGDGATPEGRYRVVRKNANSRFHRSLMLNYPDDGDREEHRRAVRSGRVSKNVGPGGAIALHGHGGRDFDWTDGCVALRDEDMQSLFDLVDVDTPVTIVGTARLPGD